MQGSVGPENNEADTCLFVPDTDGRSHTSPCHKSGCAFFASDTNDSLLSLRSASLCCGVPGLTAVLTFRLTVPINPVPCEKSLNFTRSCPGIPSVMWEKAI